MKQGWKRVSALCLMALIAGLGVLRPATAQNGGVQSRLTIDYQKALEIIRNNYIVETTDENLTKAAIQGMLKTLDPHSDYMDRKSFQEFNEKQHSQYFGIGSLISTRHRQTMIIEPFKDTPAYRAGFRYGDHIVAVDGKDTSTWPSDRVRTLLLGERGTQLTVSVRRPGIAEPITRTITRDGIWLPSIPNVYMVKPGVGYIGLTRNFQSTTARELTQAMADLREKGAENFILDLRGNGGGYLDQAIRVCDQVLQRGQVIVSQRGRTGRGFDQQAIAENGAAEIFPLVVMIDRATASASEIVAGAIQDHDRGLIIGEPSFGKGLVQRIFPLQTGGALTLTIAQYFTPSGRLIQRDYSNGSIFEYYSRRTSQGDTYSAPKRGEEKKTDLGRIVYGGNGIEPDIKVESAEFFTVAQGRLFHGLFMFSRELINGQIAGFPQFKVAGLNHDFNLKGGEYNIGDDLLNAFRDFAVKFYKDNPDYGVTPAMIDENRVWVRKQLRQEVLVAAFGNDKAQQGMADLDLPLQRAIAEMPAAADLAQRSWKRSTGLNRSK
ncbi:MAG: S41 family peptidase [Blastocatellia bacterium]